eukprot:991700-Pyramimonas_sp.AAC.1
MGQPPGHKRYCTRRRRGFTTPTKRRQRSDRDRPPWWGRPGRSRREKGESSKSKSKREAQRDVGGRPYDAADPRQTDDGEA